MSASINPDIITDGLVLCLDAGNSASYPGSGTLWTDLSGNGNNGTLTNGPTYSSANKGGIVFDGTNDYVICGSGSQYNLGNNFTLSSWVYPTQVGHAWGDEIFSLATTNVSPYVAYGLEWMDTYKFNASIGNTLNVTKGISTTNTFSLNQWYNVVETYDQASIKIYVNGILENSLSVTDTVKYGTNILTIGTWYYDINPNNALTGRISNIGLYNRALISSEISQNYKATKGRYGL